MRLGNDPQRTVRMILSSVLLVAISTMAVTGQELDHGVAMAPVDGDGEATAWESDASRSELNTYGTLDNTVYYVTAEEFTPLSSSSTWSLDSSMFRFVSGGGPFLRANVHLPAGARVTGVELTGCDDNAGADIAVHLFRNQDPSSTATLMTTFSTTGSPGCSFFSNGGPIDVPVIDNLNYKYTLSVGLGNDDTLRFRGVRIFYRLQVSPPPGTATFDDVPTGHLFFQHIEALVASGITAGCGGGDYCPDALLTRGQMAVFLAKALGLHWPF